MNIDDTFHGISTLIQAECQEIQSFGSGFFYQELAEKDPSKTGYGWREIMETWLVTNRHVLLPKIDEKECIPERITFHMRAIEGENVAWDPIEITTSEIKQRLKLHQELTVDIVILRIGDLITKQINTGRKYMAWSAVSEEDLPQNSGITAEVADDVIVVGYPRGFYDRKNIYPIVKSGIIASRWGMKFDGKPIFLIDSKLFPGSSGSIVITKPTASPVDKGPLKGYRETQFAFLGVYSGSPIVQISSIDLGDFTITRKDSCDLGAVWYGELIPEIVKNGIQLS